MSWKYPTQLLVPSKIELIWWNHEGLTEPAQSATVFFLDPQIKPSAIPKAQILEPHPIFPSAGLTM